MSGIQIKKSVIQTIDLNGVYGIFAIQNAAIKVHYFSTFANPDPGSTGGHFQLLQQLTPMRERVEASNMSSLDALLQRDLSDERIASDLIPYLQGKFSKVGFFPAILAVILPRGFITGTEECSYPLVSSTGNLDKTYSDGTSDFWGLSIYPDENNEPTRMGMLSINSQKSDIIVIDGQHRANAFRYAAGCSNIGPTSTYQPFYKNVSVESKIESDLPVTIIWFESTGEEKVQPTDISRELFVAVNNSAKTVSESRTVLLDEVNISSLGVNTYYQYLAEHDGFRLEGGMNLLTSGFDMDSELSLAVRPKMTLTNPTILHKVLAYAFFGSKDYDKIKENVRRGNHTYEERYLRYFKKKHYFRPEPGTFKVLDSNDRKEFRSSFNDSFRNVIDLMFEENALVKVHHQAVVELDQWVKDNSDPTYCNIWNNVFCGGEGLYSAFMGSSLDSCKEHKKYIKSINEQFSEIRRKLFAEDGKSASEQALSKKEIDQCYESFNTVAFQVGFVMAVEFMERYYHEGDLAAAVDVCRERFGKVTTRQWACFFNKFREEYIGSLDPNSWTKIKNMLLRILSIDFGDIFEKETEYPEYHIVAQSVKKSVRVFYDTYETLPNTDDLERMSETSADSAFEILSFIGVKPLDKSRLIEIGKHNGQSEIDTYEEK